MDRTVIALYRDFPTAREAVEALVDAGLMRDHISLVASNREAGTAADVTPVALDDEDDVTAGEGAGFGAVVGALVGLGVALIPGIGPVLAAGPLAAAIMAGIGAAAGAATGGIVAALADFGVPEAEAEMYAEGLRQGAALVSVTANEEHMPMVEDILNRYRPLDLDERATGWQAAEPGMTDVETTPLVGMDATSAIQNPVPGRSASGEIAARTGTTTGMPETDGFEDEEYHRRARVYNRR